MDFTFSPEILLRFLYMCLPDVLCCSLVELRVVKADVYARLEAWIQAANTICGQKEDVPKALITETRDDMFLLAVLRVLLSLSTETNQLWKSERLRY